MRRFIALTACAVLSTTAFAQSALMTGSVITPGGQRPSLQPSAIFVQSCNGGLGGIAGQSYDAGVTTCAVPVSGSGGGGGGDASAVNQTRTQATPGNQSTYATGVQGVSGGFPQNIAATTAVSTSTAGTVTTANTYQSALTASTTRKGCLLINTSANIEYVFLGAPGSATTATSIPLAAGQSLNCASGSIVISDQLSITSATATSAFLVISQ